MASERFRTSTSRLRAAFGICRAKRALAGARSRPSPCSSRQLLQLDRARSSFRDALRLRFEAQAGGGVDDRCDWNRSRNRSIFWSQDWGRCRCWCRGRGRGRGWRCGGSLGVARGGEGDLPVASLFHRFHRLRKAHVGAVGRFRPPPDGSAHLRCNDRPCEICEKDRPAQRQRTDVTIQPGFTGAFAEQTVRSTRLTWSGPSGFPESSKVIPRGVGPNVMVVRPIMVCVV